MEEGEPCPGGVLRARNSTVPARQSRSSKQRSATSPGRSPRVDRHNTTARSLCPYGVEASNEASTLASCRSLRHRGSVESRQWATAGTAASSRSSQSPWTRKNRKNDRSAVRTAFIERGENRPLIEPTKSITWEGLKRLGSIGSSPRVRIPGEAGQGFRCEAGHRSGVKAATLSDAKAATCGWSSEGWPASIGRVAAFRSERATSWAPTLWHPRPSRRREGDAGTETQHEENSGGVAAAAGVRFEPAAGRSGVRCREGERSGLPGAGAAGRRAGSGVGELERRGARATALSGGAATDAARATGGGLGAGP